MQVEYFIINDVVLNGQALSVEEMAEDPTIIPDHLKHRYCVTAVCAGDGKVYCGCTNTGGDILYEFDVRKKTFRSLNFASVAEPCDAKIHRGLWLDRKRNCLVFGIATLSSVKDVAPSAGARIMRYDLATGTYHELLRPMVGNYLQAIVYDADRQMAYGFTEPAKGFTVSDLARGETRWARCVESIVHTSTLDPAGGVWGTWAARTKHPFFRYDPADDRIEFFSKLAITSSEEARGIMYPGAGPIDCMITGPDGLIYVASALGELYRLDPVVKKVDYLGRPVPHNRLPGLVFAPDGLLYGIGGTDWRVTLWRYDRIKGAFQILGELAAPDRRRCFRPHDITWLDGRFYIGETDNPKNSGCLWAVTV